MPQPCKSPCKSCPWRVDNHAEDIPNFRLDLAESLVSTTSDQLGAPTFACHLSRDDEEFACAGWLARYGWNNIGVRLGLAFGRYTADMLEPGDDWPATHETFDEVIAKLREDCA